MFDEPRKEAVSSIRTYLIRAGGTVIAAVRSHYEDRECYMNILVCIKQVLDDSVEIGYDEAKGKFTPDGVSNVENAFDTYALEMAVRLKEALNEGEITLLSIGGEPAKDALKNGLAVGGDSAVLIKADNYQDVDSYSVAKGLADGIRKLEEQNSVKYDIVFCGKETTDFAAGQVGVILAGLLNKGIITDLVDIGYAGGKVTGKHETETGYDSIEAAAPCVVTVGKPLYDPRYATIKSKMAARKKEIAVLDGITLQESAIEVKATRARPKRKAGVKINGKPAEEAVAEAMALMSDAKAI